MRQTDRTLQEAETSLPGPEVLAAAKKFFARNLNIYSAFLEKEGPTYATFRGQGGEELTIAVENRGSSTRVTASSYLFDQQISRFFVTLPPAGNTGPEGRS